MGLDLESGPPAWPCGTITPGDIPALQLERCRVSRVTWASFGLPPTSFFTPRENKSLSKRAAASVSQFVSGYVGLLQKLLFIFTFLNGVTFFLILSEYS